MLKERKIDFRNEVPVNIVKGANLENIMKELYEVFRNGRDSNAELVNDFFSQPYFEGEESIIDKFTDVDVSLDFDDIKDEGINLAILTFNDEMRDFKYCIDRTSNDVKRAFVDEIHDVICVALGGTPNTPPLLATPPATGIYHNFDVNCPVPMGTSPNVTKYFEDVVKYLKECESNAGGIKTVDILKPLWITNDSINTRLSGASQLNTTLPLLDPSHNPSTKNSFDILLSFEIGREADRTINIANDIANKLEGLFSNAFPAINTIIGENKKLRYNEGNLGPEYQTRLEEIRADATLRPSEKNRQIQGLKWTFYLEYLKDEDPNIGEALEQLYNNNFDYSQLDDAVLKGYLESVADLRIKALFDSELNDSLKINFGNLDDFKNFYVGIADPTSTVLHLGGGIDLTVQKEKEPGEHPWLKRDLDEFGSKWASYDYLPINYEIKKSDIETLPISIEDRTNLLNFLSRFKDEDEEKYKISGKEAGSLLYLFFISNSFVPITTIDLDKQKEIEDLFGDTRKGKEREKTPEEKEKFIKDIEKLGSGTKFENGSEIWMPMGDSELPGGGYQWMKIKVSDVDMLNGTFKGKIFGGELKFGAGLEGTSRFFEMNQESLDYLKGISKDSGKIFLLPDPDKSSDFGAFKKDKLNNKLGSDDISFPGGVKWNGRNFVRNISGKDENVDYFGVTGDDNASYIIKYNPVRRSFKVSTTYNGEVKGNDGKSENVRYSYSRDMDWNNFLLFFTQKGLVPQTEEEAKIAEAKQKEDFKIKNGYKWKLNWFSISNLKNVFKNIKGNIKKKIDNYNKEQDEKLENILIGDRGLYDKLAGLLGFIPSMKYGLGELQQEYYNERDNRSWKKIEYYLKLFQSDPDFGTTFEKVPPFAKTLGGKSYKEFVEDLFKDKNRGLSDDPSFHKAAAILLANIEKGGSPYRGLSGEENSGFWVKVILGKDHYKKFLDDKEACINDLKRAGKEKDQIEDVLATCEMDYIINNVSGANGKLKYFGTHEEVGEDGMNPAKRILSNQFADKLKGAYKGRFNKSSVEEALGKITHNDFNLAKEDFKRFLKSSRFPQAIANLKKMFLLAKDSKDSYQESEYQKCFLVYMLSGVLDVNGKKDLRKQTYQRAKTMGFLPGMLAKNPCHSEQVVTLMDDFCQEMGYTKFSDSVKSYFHEGDLKEGLLKIDDLIGEVDAWWGNDGKTMKAFEQYSQSIFPTKSFPKGSVLQKLQESALDTGMENMDNSLLDNPVVANKGGLLSNANIVRDRMALSGGTFEGKDPDERNNRALFWSNIAADVRRISANNKKNVNFVLNQYFSWFGLNSDFDRHEAYEWIKTAYLREDSVGGEVHYEYKGKDLIMGVLSKDDITDVVWYTFKGKVMTSCFGSRRIPPELNDALDAFQEFFMKAYDNKLLENELVVSDAFKSGDIGTSTMRIGSRLVYKEAFGGDSDSYSEDIGVGDDDFTDPKQRHKAQRNSFRNGNFINYKMAQMEKKLKNLPPEMYRQITEDVNDDATDKIKVLKKKLKS